MTMSKVEAQALANGVHRIRPDWDFPLLMHAINRASVLGTPAAISAALYRLADNLNVRSPDLLAEPGPHWGQTTTASRLRGPMCPEHPSIEVAKCSAPDGPCGLEAATADREQGIALVRAAIREHGLEGRGPERRPGHMTKRLKAELDAIQTRRAHQAPAEAAADTTTEGDPE